MARSRKPIRPGWHAIHQFKSNTRRVTDIELRQIFSHARILERANRHELTVEIDPERDGHPSPPRADEPVCTRSHILIYRTLSGQVIAKAHRYLREDGTIGAFGRPDPKEVVHNGILHYVPLPG